MPTHRARGAHPRSRGVHRVLPPAPAPLYAPGPCGGAGVHELVQPRRPWPYISRSQPQAPACPRTLHAARSSRTYPPNTSPTHFHSPHLARIASTHQPTPVPEAPRVPAHQARPTLALRPTPSSDPSLPACVGPPHLLTHPPAHSPPLPRPPPPPRRHTHRPSERRHRTKRHGDKPTKTHT